MYQLDRSVASVKKKEKNWGNDPLSFNILCSVRVEQGDVKASGWRRDGLVQVAFNSSILSSEWNNSSIELFILF